LFEFYRRNTVNSKGLVTNTPSSVKKKASFSFRIRIAEAVVGFVKLMMNEDDLKVGIVECWKNGLRAEKGVIIEINSGF